MDIANFVCIPKHPLDDGEDRIFVSDHFVAVVDGATPKASPPGGATPKAMADRIIGALGTLPRSASARAAINEISAAVVDFIEDGPAGASAAVIIYSVARREIWSVGSGFARIGTDIHQFGAAHENAAARTRAAYLTALLQEGATVQSLQRDDPGRELIMPLLRNEYRLRNVESDGPWFFGSIDGTFVPDRYIKRLTVPVGSHSVILASDGYPAVAADFQACEAYLADLMASDPLMIGSHPQTKGLTLGAVGYDDRSLIEINLGRR